MASVDLYIIAAGNGSRINAGVPKALLPIIDEPCITTTLRRIGRKFRRVFVVTNVLVSSEWTRYFRRLEGAAPELAEVTVNLPIKSGLGDGHATLQGLLAAEKLSGESLAEDVVVAWGDAFFLHPELIDELLSIPLAGAGLFPVIHENNPYVSLLVDAGMQCVSVDFSKYGECHPAGLHDQSVFRFLRSALRTSLRELHNSLWKNGRYITPGGELSLLYSVHQLYNAGHAVYAYETQYATRGFNTVEEIAAIQREIGVLSDEALDYPKTDDRLPSRVGE